MLYCFKNLLMPRKKAAHGWSSQSIKRGMPCVFCSLQCKEQKVELNCWSRKTSVLSLLPPLLQLFQQPVQFSSAILTGHLSLLSLTASVNALYNLAALSSFMSFSVPHLQLTHLSVLPIPAILLTSQGE